jgi:hypothetical protein
MPMPLSLSESQTAFSAALLAPGMATSANIIRPDGYRADRRFAVYRNNVAVSLIDALQANFPVTCKLVGEAFFRAMAGEFASVETPKTPVLSEYGDGLPNFISSFRPAQDLPYLADVAAVELAWSQAYHAADRAYLSSLEGLNEQELAQAICVLHPSVRFVSSPFPAGAIWLGHQAEPFSPPLEWKPESILLVRPEAEISLHVLQLGEFAFAQKLCSGERLEEAAIIALGVDPSFNPGAGLIKLVKAGAISTIRTYKSDEGE